jgi:integrase
VDRTRLPRFSKAQTGREIPEEELARILETAREHRLFAAFYLLAAYGLRRGEVLGLMWPDVDFEGGLLHIRRALVPDNRTARLILGPTKTSGSDRTLPLTEEAREVLLAHRERLEMDGLYHPEGFVFPSLAGTPVRPENLYRVWTRLLAKAGVPRARIHDLRSTFITRVVRETKNPKLAAVLAGHKSLTVAMQHYTRVSEQDLKTALKGLSLTRNNREDDKG